MKKKKKKRKHIESFNWIFIGFSLDFQRLKPNVDEVDGPKSIEHFPSDKDQTVIRHSDDSKDDIDERGLTVLAPRADGLVREKKTKKVISREEIQERTETEDVKHLGDFSDEVSLMQTIVKLLILIIINHILFTSFASHRADLST